MSTVSTQRLVYFRSSVDGSLLRTAELNGTSYLVVPCVSKLGDNVEWPINAPYPELIPSDVLSLATHMRNNRPVVMGHPQSDTGDYVSANTPDILAKYAFGHVFNARFESDKVLCDLWLDPARASAVGPDAESVIQRLQAGQTVEVSEGNYVVVDETPGEWNGRKFGAKWVLCFPDHVATLREDEIGACSIEDGCGALRASQGFEPVPFLRVASGFKISALAQARRPSYTGTETSTWSRPTFADYIRYLYNGDSPPGSVSQCSMDLKRAIADHTLLGDPEASNFSDLSAVPVVNPATSYLNENALRSVLAGRGLSGLSDSAVSSAQEMCRRLLNSEFSANLEVSRQGDANMNQNENPAPQSAPARERSNLIRRLFASVAETFRSSMSNNELRQKLYKALKPLEPGLSYVYDEDVEAKVVRYVVLIWYGDYYDGESEWRFYTRTFELNGSDVTVHDDAVQVEWYEGWRPVGENAATASNSVSGRVSESGSGSGACGCRNVNSEAQASQGGETVSINRSAIIARLSATPQFAPIAGALNSMSDQNLEALDKAYPATAPAQAETPESGVGAGPNATNEPAANSVSISREEHAELQAYRAAQAARKSSLVASLSASQSAFTAEDLQAMDVSQLEKLAQLSGSPSMMTNSGSAPTFVVPVPAPASSPTRRKLPDTWGLEAARAKRKQQGGSPDSTN